MALHPGVAAAEWAVFHGSVREALVALDSLGGVDSRSAAHVNWLRAVALGAAGRYGQALEVVDRIGEQDPEFSMARSLRASLLRQLGAHDVALVADQQALASAKTPGAAIEAMTGLAADAVGLQDAATASSNLAKATSLLDRVGAASPDIWWRHRVRSQWVACEVALLQSQSRAALTDAQAALQLAEAANAPRHVAKSLLFVAVSQIETGDREGAKPHLRRCLTLSTPMGYLAVAWPAHAVLGALLKPSDPQAARAAFASASEITDTLRADLSGDLAARWDRRADIAGLHREAS